MRLIDATNIKECTELLLKLSVCKWWQFRTRYELKRKIENQFVRPNEKTIS